MTPCPYLPVYGGNLRERSFKEIWEDSEVFNRIRARNALGGRCGACEFNRVCGGCRARAYGATGDYLAEDDWCVYEPGAYDFQTISFEGKTTYGLETAGELEWTPAARERLAKVPSFVRGMLAKRVEAYAREKGCDRVDVELMQEVRELTLQGRIGNVPPFVRQMLKRD